MLSHPGVQQALESNRQLQPVRRKPTLMLHRTFLYLCRTKIKSTPSLLLKPSMLILTVILSQFLSGAGRGWAASRAEGKATPVTRPINIVALKDRWLLRSDVDPKTFDECITMDEGPQQAGNQLASALKSRVDSWGLAVKGGFWSPSLTIESASDAQQSVVRLEKLLEGSGVEIKVVPLKSPGQR